MVASRPLATRELDQVLVEAILRRLAEGQSAKGIARDLHVSRTSVRRLRSGEHVSQIRGLQFVRCDGCGGLVVLPCRGCAQRQPPPANEP